MAEPRDTRAEPDGDTAPDPKQKARRRSGPARPWWRRRRFWQLVIAVELVAALAVSYLAADDAGATPISPRAGLSAGTVGGT